MRLIDADKVEYITKEQAKELVVSALFEAKRVEHIGVVGMIFEELENIPSADVIPVVRCRDCKKWEADNTYEFDIDGAKRMWGSCSNSLHHCKDNHFCSYGERRGELEEAK